MILAYWRLVGAYTSQLLGIRNPSVKAEEIMWLNFLRIYPMIAKGFVCYRTL